MDDQLSTSLQESVLTLLAFGHECGQIAAGLVDPKLWEEPYNDICRRAIDYRQKYGVAPGKDHIDDLFDHVISDPENKRAPLYQRILLALYKQSSGLNEQYVLDRVGEFVRRQTYKGVVHRAAQRIAQGGDNVGDDVESILDEAHRFRMENTDAGVFMDEPAALAFLDDDAFDTLKLGIPTFDRLDINPTRGELFVFIAPRGRGKSWMATHCSVMALLQNWRVADITLEMSQKRKSQRIYQAMFAAAKRDDEFSQTVLKLNGLGLLEDIDSERRRPELGLRSPDALRYLSEKQNEWRDQLARLSVKQYPSGSLTMRKLRSHLDFLEQAKGFTPDLLVVDYPMIMYIDPDRPREALGRHFIELRGLAQERNMAVVALHQSTRAGETATNLRSQHAAEDISIFGTADIAITYNATEQERARGLARLFAAKVRNDQSDVGVLITQNYNSGQFVLQSVPQRSNYWTLFNEFHGDGAALATE